MRRILTPLVLVLAVVLVAAGCGDDADPVTTDPGDAGGAGGSDRGLGLLVSIEHVGGFTTPQGTFATLPHVVVYDDGRTITPGAMIAIYPGPAVPPLVAGRLDPDERDEVLARAEEAGLLEPRGPDEFAPSGVADVPDTRITVVVDGEEVVTVVPALGFGDVGVAPADPGLDAPGAAPAPGEELAPDVDDRAAEPAEVDDERAAIDAFVQWVSGIATDAEEGFYEPERYRVLASPYTEEAVDEGIEPNELDWPADVALAGGECIAVTGDDADALAAALDEATQITRWLDAAGDAWAVTIRPVLPHEPDC